VQQKQTKKKKSHIPLRINILFFIVFLLFSILILRLGILQIVQGEEYRRQVERKDEISVNYSVPRGEIYDRNYHQIVYNIPQKAITYTPPKNPSNEELLDIAQKLSKLIKMDEKSIDKVTTRDYKDLWILLNDNGNDKITKEEETLFKEGELTDKELYQLKLDRVTDEDIATIDKNVAAIYRKIFNARGLTPTIVKNKDVTDEEYALVSENLSKLPGVDITTDWERKKIYENVFLGVLGQMSEGLPSDKLDYYLSKGYSLNDRVGISYLEEMYEDVLRGTKSKVKTITDKSGSVIDTKVISEGHSGKDIVLTIDIELQKEIEKIIQEELKTMMGMNRTETLDSAFVVAMDPNTGEILSLAGKTYDRKTKEFNDYSRGTFTAAFEFGSAVKGATLLTGFQTGVVKINERMMDEPLVIPSTPRKASYQNMGLINDLTALERSSNVYMWKIAIEIMDGHYVRNQPLPLNREKMNVIRYYFSQFGLGVKTGIGFDQEIEGLKGNPQETGNLMDIAIGQLDTYTPLQMAQYVSTIANGGYRMKPILVKEIISPDPGSDEKGTIVEVTKPEVLNRVDMKEEYIKRVQQGFWQVTHGSRGTARAYFANEPYDAAGKTGTAESYKDGKKTWNLSFVGYAPYNKPEIAISVIVPNAYQGKDSPYPITNVISQRVFRAYFDLKEERMKEESTQEQGENEAEDRLNNETEGIENTEGTDTSLGEESENE